MEAIYNFDFSVLDGIQSHLKCNFLDILMPFVSNVGGGFIWAVLGLIMLFIKKQRINGFTLLAALVITVLATEFLIKPIFMRERPFIQNGDFALLVSEPFGSSFPSAHTSTAFASAVQLFRINRKSGIIAVVFAAVTGFSRLYLYVHFPTDVLVGAALGTLMGLAVLALSRKIMNRKERQTE